MALIRFVLISLIIVVSSSCSEELISVNGDTTQTPQAETEENVFVTGELIVEFTDDFVSQLENEGVQTKASLRNDLSYLGVTEITRLYPDAGEWEERHRAAGLHKWYRIHYSEEKNATKASLSLSNLDFVSYAEPSRRIKSTATYNDPFLGRQWNYNNLGTGAYSKDADINVTPVWENFTAGDEKVIVAIVDGGIQMDHPDLHGVVIPAGINGSKCFVSGYTGYNIYPHAHGTHVAGTIGAINNNGIGVCGIAGGKDGNGGVRLLSCQVFKDNPDDPKKDIGGDTYNAMVWGADHGAIISQNSWGYVYKTAAEARTGGVGAMKSAIDYFIKNAGCDKEGNQRPDSPMKGGVVIFAAGNEGWPDGWPAEYEPVIAVGAINATLNRSSYSNYGDWVDICAPGGDYGIDAMITSTLPNGTYGTMQGTSMACPHVSGVAALIVSYFGGPGFTNEMLVDRLLGGANKETSLKNSQIGPLVDAYGSFMMGGTVPPVKVDPYSVNAVANSLRFTWKVTEDSDAPNGKAYGYLLMASKNESDFTGLDLKSIPPTMKYTIVEDGDSSLGEEMSGTLENLDFLSDYFVSIAAYDFNKNYSPLADVKTIKTLTNNAPVIEMEESSEIIVHAHETKKLHFNIYDPDGHAVAVKYTSGSSAENWKDEGNMHTLAIVGKNAESGNYTATIKATDNGAGNFALTTTLAVNYTIMPNNKPEKVKELENRLMENTGMSFTLDMSEYIRDVDGETLRYEITHSNQTVCHVNPMGNMLTVTSLNFGVDEITIKAYDCMDEYCECSFKVCVRKDADGIDVYPTAVKDYLYVASVLEKSLTVKVVTSTGKTVASVSGDSSIFDPVSVDMSGFAHGVYSVVIEADDSRTIRTVTKL